MATNPRAKAQRETAARVRANRGKAYGERTPILPRAITRPAARANIAYADRVITGQEPHPNAGSLESKNLARLAALARWGKADPKYLEFQNYWYHNREG